MRHTDGVSNLQFHFVRKTCRHHIFTDVTRHVSRTAVYLGRIFARKRAAAVRTSSAVCIHYDFSARQTGIAFRSAHGKFSRRIDEVFCVAVQKRRRHDRADHVFYDIRRDLFLRHVFAMLRRYDNRIDTNGRSAVVFYRNLRFPVGAEIFQQTRLSHFRQSLRQTMRKDNGKRHIFFRLAARITEHQALISRAEQIVLAAARFMFAGSIHAERDICGLTVDQFEDAAPIVCESAEIVTDLFDHLTRGLLVIDVRLCRNFAR